MKTPEHVQRSRANHHAALKALHIDPTKADGLKMWRSLLHIEKRAEAGAMKWSNGDTTEAQWEETRGEVERAVSRVFGRIPTGFFVNSDPRGYALKLDNDKTTIPEGMHKDWGGYGILAPEINS